MVAHKTAVAPPVTDLSALAESYYIHLEIENKSPKTIAAYRAGVTAYLLWHSRQGPGEPLLDKPAAGAWLLDLMRAGNAPGTVRLRATTLKLFSKWLVEEGVRDTDELVNLASPSVPEPLVPKLTEDELDRLVKACKGTSFLARRDEAMVRMLAECGLRAGELIGLEVGDIDLHARIATVRHGKGGKFRRVVFGPETTQALDRYLRARRAHKLAGTPALWLGTQGRPFGYQGLLAALGKRATAAGVAKFHPHRLRHTFASRWLQAGGSEGGLMSQAGWSNRQMLDRYVKDSSAERSIAEARRLDLGRI